MGTVQDPFILFTTRYLWVIDVLEVLVLAAVLREDADRPHPVPARPLRRLPTLMLRGRVWVPLSFTFVLGREIKMTVAHTSEG